METEGQPTVNGMVRMNADCLACLLKKELEKIPDGTPDEKRMSYMQRLMRLVGAAKRTQSPPEVMRDILTLQKEMFGVQTDYPKLKSFFNKKMLQYADRVAGCIESAADPLLRAIQFSMCGNYIDFGVPHAVTEEKLDRILWGSDQIPVQAEVLQAIRENLETAKKVVVLLDNCGEIVLDKILIMEIRRQYPRAEVTAVVRGAEVVNDVSLVDAEEVGLAEVAAVLANGDDTAGTCPDKISGTCRQLLEKADVILAKGQANFETLRGCGLNVFYMFLCKCELFQKRFGVPPYTGMLVHEKEAVRVL